MLKHFRIDFIITIAALVGAFLYGGTQIVVLTAILIVLEIVFSFDNAAVNAKYLERMSPFWRKMFLTVGILIAVFGMRLIFPFVIVCLSGSISPVAAWQLAMEKGDPHTPGTYGYILDQAHPTIAAFGGMFLIMLFLNFIFDTERDSVWLSWIEKPLLKAGHFEAMSVATALGILMLAATYLTHGDERLAVLEAGLLGIFIFVVVNGLSSFMEARQEAKDEELDAAAARSKKGGGVLLLTGKAAFSMFLFLEVLDASFSFDGVLGAFAITSDPIIIAIGLGVGAMYVRSMTIYLVEDGTLAKYEFLEHGAHWAIGVLAVLLVLTLRFDIPDFVIGLSGMVFIVSALITSVRKNKREAAELTTT